MDLPGKSIKTPFFKFAWQIHGFAWQICIFYLKNVQNASLSWSSLEVKKGSFFSVKKFLNIPMTTLKRFQPHIMHTGCLQDRKKPSVIP